MSDLIDARTRRTIAAAVSDVMTLVGADAASVWLRGADGFFRIVATRGVGAMRRWKDRLPELEGPLTREHFATDRLRLVPKLNPAALGGFSPRNRATLRRNRMQAYAAVPIRFEGGGIAMLTMAFRREHDFPAREIGTLRLVGRQIGAILEASTRLRESRARVRAMSAIAEVSALVAGSLDLTGVLRRITGNARRILDAGQAIVFLREAGGTLVGAASSGGLPGAFGIRVGPGEPSVVQLALRRRTTEVIRDARTDPRVSRKLMRKFGTRAFIATPLIAHGKPMGVLCIVESRGPRIFDAKEVELLETLANYAAIAIGHARTHASLLAREGELRALSGRLADAHESERRRIARELHDVVGQGLAALALDLAAMERTTGATMNDKLSSARRLLKETTQAARRLSAELHPAVVEDLGLVPAVRWYCGELSRRSGLQISFAVSTRRNTPAIPPQPAFVLYRAVQEGLNNVLRHARAKNVTVRLRMLAPGYRLEIQDDGVGPVRDSKRRGRPGIGLLSIRERTQPLGGIAKLEAIAPKGSRLVVEIPRAREPA